MLTRNSISDVGDIVQTYEFQNNVIGKMQTNNSILEDEIVNSRVQRQTDLHGAFSSGGGGLHGAFSSGGGYSTCPEGIPAETAILTLLGAFGLAFGILYRAVTLAGRRRKKRDIISVVGNTEPQSLMDEISNHLADLYWWGMCLYFIMIYLISYDIIIRLSNTCKLQVQKLSHSKEFLDGGVAGSLFPLYFKYYSILSNGR